MTLTPELRKVWDEATPLERHVAEFEALKVLENLGGYPSSTSRRYAAWMEDDRRYIAARILKAAMEAVNYSRCSAEYEPVIGKHKKYRCDLRAGHGHSHHANGEEGEEFAWTDSGLFAHSVKG